MRTHQAEGAGEGDRASGGPTPWQALCWGEAGKHLGAPSPRFSEEEAELRVKTYLVTQLGRAVSAFKPRAADREVVSSQVAAVLSRAHAE